jgi:hypothetical protein
MDVHEINRNHQCVRTLLGHLLRWFVHTLVTMLAQTFGSLLEETIFRHSLTWLSFSSNWMSHAAFQYWRRVSGHGINGASVRTARDVSMQVVTAERVLGSHLISWQDRFGFVKGVNIEDDGGLDIYLKVPSYSARALGQITQVSIQIARLSSTASLCASSPCRSTL